MEFMNREGGREGRRERRGGRGEEGEERAGGRGECGIHNINKKKIFQSVFMALLIFKTGI